jgi:hypothetical protein
MDISKLFDIAYLLENQPNADSAAILPMAIIFLLITVIGLAIQIATALNMFHPVSRGFLRRIPGTLYMFTFFGLIFLFARHETSPLLSMRIFLAITFLLLFLYVLWKIIAISRAYPKRMQTYLSKKGKL